MLAGCTNQTGPNYTRRTNSDRLHPRAPIRPRGVKRVKSLKGLTPQSAALTAPLAKGSYGGLLPFYPFYYRVRVWPPPITQEKPPGFVTGRLTLSNCQREVSHCLRAQPGQPRHAAARLFIRVQRVSAADWRAWSSSSPRRLNLPMPRTKSAMGMGFGFVKLR